MTLLSRLIANLLLPLLFFCGGYLLLYQLGENLISKQLLQPIAITIALLLASIPAVAFAFLIRSQLKPGFALLKNGNVVLLGEITLEMVLTHRITAWKLYQQHLDTEVCLQGNNELIYVKMGLDFQIPANARGKQFIKHYSNNMAIFEAWVQRAIYIASLQDRELVHILPDSVLLNEEDERVLRSKFLSALETQPLKSVRLPLDTSGIRIDRQIRTRANASPPLIANDQEILPDDALSLDQKLIQDLGLE